ncbi:MAG TPA: enoyl-CoA hydratase-related protein [Candidatus Thermoplasmatota archaeon]|jgi:enoyl-CoA hydratase/3-hydroxyacyl-CoA dehydrogenase|nr:enoyl-CoA hydratase-related protein [Candidatus Thermoplasmatota archaeon]
MTIQRVAVIGAGTMGSGIAQACAQSGFQVLLHDVKPEFVRKGLDRITDQLQKRVDKGKLDKAEKDAILARIRTTTSLAEAGRDADLVIEAVFEEMKVKEDVFKQLDAAAPASCIFATNTSSLSVNQLARVTARPDRFGGLHFFNPAAVNLLLEAIRGDTTNDGTWASLLKFGGALGKTTIVVKDSPGFAVNRFFVPLLNEACRLQEEGFSTATIDAGAKEALGISMGPFELMNFTGIPIAYHSQVSLSQLGPFYAPAASLKKQFESGKLWELQGAPEQGKLPAVKERILGVAFGIAAQLVEEGVASIGDTDKGAIVGLRWARGPFALMNEVGPRDALRLVEGVSKKYGPSAFRVPAQLRAQAERGQPWHIPRVQLERRGAVAILTIDRPEALNALNREVLRDLIAATEEVDRDPSLHCMVLTGAGKAFIAGADIGIMAEVSALESREYTKLGQKAARKLERMEKPVIAAVNGFAFGGGTELALACDIILASDRAVFGLPEVTLGIHPGFGGTQRLPRLIGKHLAKELIFTGQQVSADRAEALGIINRVVPHEKLLDEAVALGQRIAANAPVAVRLAKAAVNRGVEVDLDTALGLEVESVTITFATEDRLEGMRAFLEKRKPEFKGK